MGEGGVVCQCKVCGGDGVASDGLLDIHCLKVARIPPDKRA